MSMFDAMDAMKTTTTGITNGPAVVQMTAQDKEDSRPGKRCNSWLNLTPVSTDRVSETGGSTIATYVMRLSLWIVKPVRATADGMIETSATMWELILDTISTGHLGGYSRLDIDKGSVQDKWESGDDGDIAYTIRAEIPVQKQEA